MKENFLAALSHELKTPLTIILGYAELLEDEKMGPLTSQQARCVEALIRASGELTHLINNLLELADLRLSGPVVNQIFVLSDLVQTVLDELRDRLDGHQLEVALFLSAEAEFEGDPDRIGSILRHLMDFCISRANDGSLLELYVSVEDGTLTLQLVHLGKLIDSQQLARWFTPMYLMGEDPDNTGLALDLALTCGEVERLGGKIWAQQAPLERILIGVEIRT